VYQVLNTCLVVAFCMPFEGIVVIASLYLSRFSCLLVSIGLLVGLF